MEQNDRCRNQLQRLAPVYRACPVSTQAEANDVEAELAEAFHGATTRTDNPTRTFIHQARTN